MDSRQPLTNIDGRKRANLNVIADPSHDMVTRSKAQIKRRKQETDPLKMGHILETIFGFLDVDSIKASRQVNPLWSVEGAKILIKKCHVKIPSDHRKSSATKDRFKAFLSLNSSQVFMIPNIVIRNDWDMKLWKSLGILGPTIKALKWNSVKRAKYQHNLEHLLDLLPNLKYLSFDKKFYLFGFNQSDSIMKTLISKIGKDRSPLIISGVDLGSVNREPMEDFHKFAEQTNIMVEYLEFKCSCFYTTAVQNANSVSKLLSTSQNVLKKLKLGDCNPFLSLLEFPFLTSLTSMRLGFKPQTARESPYCKLPTSFKFSKNTPNLQKVILSYVKDQETPIYRELLAKVFKDTGTAPSVKSVKCLYDCSELFIDSLFETFPNVEDFEARLNPTFETMLRSLWTRGKNLRKLTLSTFFRGFDQNFPDLDCSFTGFAPETVAKMKESPNLDAYTPEELEKLRVGPSILNLKELEQLSIYCYAGYKPKKTLAVSAKYAFTYLPNLARIVLHVHECELEGLKNALEEVFKLPNVTVEYIINKY